MTVNKLNKKFSEFVWFDDFTKCLSSQKQDWLKETNSMTKRLEKYANKISINVIFEDTVTSDQIIAEQTFLPKASLYWLREVMILGDNIPWLLARTVAPTSTLSGSENKLGKMGTTPIGRYLFSSPNLTRDFIHVGQIHNLWGRRSRLRLSGKPLLLTELFLSDSPFY